MADKSSHSVAQYGPGDPEGEHCEACTMYEEGSTPHCTVVVDPISPSGWCRYFKRES